jgi:transcriptional regulator with XRE-family HTH domain
MRSKAEYEEALLKVHRLHEGLYRRVAEKLGVDPSYVSRVAAGKRQDQSIRLAILDEIRKIQRLLG